MATYGFRRPDGGTISRAKGHSVIAKAAYNAREKLTEERTGDIKDYSKAYGGEDLVFAGIYAPKNAPEWATDRGQLWNHVDEFEKRSNSRLARQFQADLPHELTDEQNRYLLQDFVRENFTRRGFIADVAIHRPGPESDQRNIHAHILITDRPLDGDEFASHKDRSIITRDDFDALRESWAHNLARHLRRHGFEVEADRMEHGHEKQEIQREKALERGDLDFAELKAAPAQIHMGKDANALERDGIETEKGEHNRLVEEWHQQAAQVRHEENRLAQMKVWAAEAEEMAADRRGGKIPTHEASAADREGEKAQAAQAEIPLPDTGDRRKEWAEMLRGFGEFPQQPPTIEEYAERTARQQQPEARDYSALNETHKRVAEDMARAADPVEVPDVAASIERAADTAESVAGKVLGGATRAIEGLAAGLENFLFGGGKAAPEESTKAAPAAADIPKSETARQREKLHQQDPQSRDSNPDLPRFHFGMDAEAIAELRRQREAAEREEQARERGRDDR